MRQGEIRHTESPVPTEGGVYLTVNDKDKTRVISHAKKLQEMGFKLYITSGTSRTLRDAENYLLKHVMGFPKALL